MTAPDRRTAVGALAAAALGVAGAVALAAGAGWAWALAPVVAGAAVLGAVSAVSRAQLVAGVVVLGVASSCWDALRYGGASLFDVLALAGVAVVGVDAALRRQAVIRWPARPLLLAFAGFTLTTALVAVFPPDSFYLASRFLLSSNDPAVAAGASSVVAGPLGDLGALGRVAIGALVLPVVLAAYVRHWDRLVLVGRAFVAGAAVSCTIAVTDYLGITGVGGALVGYVSGDNRSTGLTSQPNQVALTAVMALPFAWVLVRRWPVRAALIGVLVAGTVVSGSRAGLVGAAVALALCAAWQYRARFLLASVPLGVVGLLALSALVSVTRFGSDGAADSDSERALVHAQGVEDFLRSPLFGIGMRVSQEAHAIYLQVLASSGLIGLLAFGILFGGALLAAYRLRHRPVVLAAGMSLVTYLAVGTATNALWTRYMFVPLAVVFVASRHLASTSEAAPAGERVDCGAGEGASDARTA